MRRIILATALLLTLVLTGKTLLAQDAHEIRQARKARRAMPVAYNVFGVNLFHVTEENIGLGINYERFLDKKGAVSLYFPVSYSLPQVYEPTMRSYSSYYSGPYQLDTTSESQYSSGMIYFYPGIKVYPWGANKKVSYAFGTSLVMGVGKSDIVNTTYNIDTFSTNNEKRFTRTVKSEATRVADAYKLGVMLTSYINLRPTPHWLIGLELGVGYSYLSRIDDRSVIGNQGVVQFGCRIGYLH